MVLCAPKGRLGSDVHGAVLEAVGHEDDEVRLALVLDRACGVIGVVIAEPLVILPDIPQGAAQAYSRGETLFTAVMWSLLLLPIGGDTLSARPHAPLSANLDRPKTNAFGVVEIFAITRLAMTIFFSEAGLSHS
jgi:hypothetical protein